jgi:hypothetical protein
VLKKLLIIGFVWPEPQSSAAGSRMIQLISAFKSRDYVITFASSSLKNDRSFSLDELGISQKAIELNSSSFDKFVKKLNPDVVLFDRFMTEEQFGWRVEEQCPKALRILDTEDLHCLRKGREQSYMDGKPFNRYYLFNETAKREIASIYRCDLSLIISEVEMEILINQFKINEELLYYLPFMLGQISQEQQSILPNFEDRSRFIFIGNFHHQPNYSAVIYLKEQIWPKIRQHLPEVEVHIYGAYANQKVNRLHDKKEGFLIKGYIENVNEVMCKARVCLVPLQFGAGLKGKMIDAMTNGTPCVTTEIGAEGLFGDMEPNGFIQNVAEKFAESGIDLYINESGWNDKQKNGFKILNHRFNKKHFQKNFLDKLKNLQKQLEIHRLNNFTRSMLMYHGLKSTKYMSKWIEEKNKS